MEEKVRQLERLAAEARAKVTGQPPSAMPIAQSSGAPAGLRSAGRKLAIIAPR